MAEIINIRSEANLDEWTSQTSDDCTWSASAALGGSSGGVLVTIDDTTATYMVKTVSTNTSGKVRCRFYFDPNSLTMASGDAFWIMGLRRESGAYLGYVYIIKSGANYQLRAAYYNDAGSITLTATIITDAPHYVEIYITRAATNVSSDGTCTWWIDGSQIDAATGIDNYDQFSNFATVFAGAVAGVDAGTSGTFYLDEFVVNDDGGVIGPLETTINLTVAEGSVTTTGDAVTLTYTGPTTNLIVAEGSVTTAGDAVTISRYTYIDDITLDWVTNIIVAEGAVTTTGDAVTLTAYEPTYSITVAEGAVSSTGDAVTFGVLHPLTVGEGAVVVTGDAVTLDFGLTVNLTVAEGSVTTSGDAVTLGVNYLLTVAEGSVTTIGDAATLGVLHTLTVAEGSVVTSGDAVTLTFTGIGETSLTVAEGNVSTTGDTITLGVLHPLTAAEGNVTTIGDTVVLTFSGVSYGITVAEGSVNTLGDAATLGVLHPLTVAEGIIAVSGDPVTITLAALILHGARRVYQPHTRTIHRAPARVTLEVDDD